MSLCEVEDDGVSFSDWLSLIFSFCDLSEAWPVDTMFTWFLWFLFIYLSDILLNQILIGNGSWAWRACFSHPQLLGPFACFNYSKVHIYFVDAPPLPLKSIFISFCFIFFSDFILIFLILKKFPQNSWVLLGYYLISHIFYFIFLIFLVFTFIFNMKCVLFDLVCELGFGFWCFPLSFDPIFCTHLGTCI